VDWGHFTPTAAGIRVNVKTEISRPLAGVWARVQPKSTSVHISLNYSKTNVVIWCL